jgi:hypothetical protein
MIATTNEVIEFLHSRGFARSVGNPFSVCAWWNDDGLIIVLDEERTFQDVNFVCEDWLASGDDGSLGQALRDFLAARQPPGYE